MLLVIMIQPVTLYRYRIDNNIIGAPKYEIIFGALPKS